MAGIEGRLCDLMEAVNDAADDVDAEFGCGCTGCVLALDRVAGLKAARRLEKQARKLRKALEADRA